MLCASKEGSTELWEHMSQLLQNVSQSGCQGGSLEGMSSLSHEGSDLIKVVNHWQSGLETKSWSPRPVNLSFTPQLL